MSIINLTPHSLTIRTPDCDVVLSPSGIVARVSSRPGEARGFIRTELTSIPIFDADIVGEVEGLPEPGGPNDVFVVSAPVGAALSPERRAVGDVLVLGTGPADGAIRENGQVKAVTRLKRA